MSRRPRVTGAELVRALQRAGFILVDVSGSHHHLDKPGSRLLVTVPVHAGRTLKIKTLQSILKQAGMTSDDLRHYL